MAATWVLMMGCANTRAEELKSGRVVVLLERDFVLERQGEQLTV